MSFGQHKMFINDLIIIKTSNDCYFIAFFKDGSGGSMLNG